MYGGGMGEGGRVNQTRDFRQPDLDDSYNIDMI